MTTDPHSDVAEQPADTLLVNGRVYTVDPSNPHAEAVAVRNGKIAAVGSDADLAILRGPCTRVVDAQGATVLPGLIDAHVHFIGAAHAPFNASVAAGTVEDAQQQIRDLLAAEPDTGVLCGHAFLVLAAGGLTASDIDAVSGDRPVALFDGHRSWLNSAALERTGIAADTAPPRGGSFDRDPHTGAPSGIINEYAAREAFFALLDGSGDAPDLAAKTASYLGAFRMFNALGFTRAVSADFDYAEMDAIDAAHRSGQMTLKFGVATLIRPPALLPEDIEELEQRRRRYECSWLSTNFVKLYQDNLVESLTGAMIDPYTTDPNDRGPSVFDPAALSAAVVELNRRGFTVLIHATGDRAVREALDAYEAANAANGATSAIKRVEHVEHVAADDIPRFAELGVIASMQPNFLSEHLWAATEAVLGTDKMAGIYPWHSLEAAGATVAHNSDFPVEHDPFRAMKTLLTRERSPEQRVTLEHALAGYTINNARAAGVADTEGSIEVGKSADLIVLSHDLFEVPLGDLDQVYVLQTFVDGELVYDCAPRQEDHDGQVSSKNQ